ncbi:aminodeoxychorismate synthase component I [Fulvimarina sp. 2208YS6-2-32]|uniref:aminodeoxychorismate synthase n=1 Tax=Fulvimarina uroteuthidis TaxID=3098149 RepID=A0ABU5I777_9HYPH|nr:aminodeoxychorismate synthase component I [Fulvimarina sp. 2208YS6-2-32]MDY8111010.1 aminodeoxychorismate synthase component I [Fulvimarina sp. 2208YS6-2-32]
MNATLPLVTEIDWQEPFEAAQRLATLGKLAFLDSAMAHDRLGRYSFVAADPFAVFTVDGHGPALDGERIEAEPLAALKSLLSRYAMPTIEGLPPFQGGALGYIAYEFAHHLESLDKPADYDPGKPSMVLALHDVVLAFDHQARRAVVFSSGHPEKGARRPGRAEARRDAVLKQLAEPLERREGLTPGYDWRSNFFAKDYEAAIERTRNYILAGDIFQANIAQTFRTALPEGFDPLALYARLRRTNAAPFGAYLDCGGTIVASSSPERFLSLDPDGRVETRPIKGTAKRSPDAAEDRALSEALLASDKDRAENVMIVDLMRNDLSRVCEPASVDVPVLCGLETYAAVHHLVSVVTGRLRPGFGAADLIGATFPGGSITGAPKIRAMDIITEIERTARGPYCGSIGYIGFDGAMDLNIAIRTVTFEKGEAQLSAGGGITVLSDPKAEYEETFTKAMRVFAAFEAGT